MSLAAHSAGRSGLGIPASGALPQACMLSPTSAASSLDNAEACGAVSTPGLPEVADCSAAAGAASHPHASWSLVAHAS